MVLYKLSAKKRRSPRHGTFPKLNSQRNQITKELSINYLICIQIWGLTEELKSWAVAWPWVKMIKAMAAHSAMKRNACGLSFRLSLLCHAVHVECSLHKDNVPCSRTWLHPCLLNPHLQFTFYKSSHRCMNLIEAIHLHTLKTAGFCS